MNTHYIGDVVGIRIYDNDVVVVRQGGNANVPETERGTIMEFSKASRQRLAFVCSNTPVVFKLMITLTYPKDFPSDGKTVKGHLNSFLTWVRRDMGNPSYLWFLEFQRRGAPHYHLLLDPPPTTLRTDVLGHLRFRVSANWYRIVGSGDSKHLAAGTRVEKIRKVDGARFYGVKYAQKMRQKTVPEDYRNVGRFWGCSRDVPPKVPDVIPCTEDDVRGVIESWRYAPSEERPVFRVLYNQSGRFCDWLSD